jgi:hypothetical protein
LLPAIRYPTVAKGTARVRVALSAAHSAEQIEALATVINGWRSGGSQLVDLSLGRLTGNRDEKTN